MTYREIATMVHEQAVKSGWHDKPISNQAYAMLLISEISEAFEEYRKDKPMLYFVTQENGIEKPEGIAVELVDCVIRLLDMFVALDIDIEIIDRDSTRFDLAASYFKRIPIEDWLLSIVKEITNVLYVNGEETITPMCSFIYVIGYISSFLKSRDLDIKELILIKHEYNKTRPYRHGNKIL